MPEWSIGQLKALAYSVAEEYGIDPDLFASLIESESNWDWKAKSVKGALGLGQLTPIAALDIGLDVVPIEPVQNLRASAAYFSKMLQRFRGRVDLALAAYNAGPTIVAATKGIPNYQETKDYVAKVTRKFRERRATVEQKPDIEVPPPAAPAPEAKEAIQGQSWTDEELEKMFPPDRGEPTPEQLQMIDQSRFILGGKR